MHSPILAILLLAFTPLFSVDTSLKNFGLARAAEQDLKTLELTEMWRVGGADDEELLLGQVVRVRSDAQGNVYFLDAQLQQAMVIDPDGELIQTLFGRGEGPGETRMAVDLTFMPDGTIAAVNRFPSSLVMVNQDGTPAGSVRLSVPGRGFAGAVQRGGNLVVAETENLPHEDGTHTVQSILGSLDSAGNRTVTYLQSDRHVDYQNGYVFEERKALVDFLYSYDVGPDGRVYALADAESYAISVFSPDGRLERVIEKGFDPRRRTKVEMNRLKALTERRFRTFPFDISYVYAENEAVVPWYFRGIQVLGDGTMWVRTSRSEETINDHQTRIVFDVFDPAGNFSHQTAVNIAGRGDTTGIFPLDDQRLVVVYGFVDAMCSVVGGGRGEMGAEGAEPDPIEIVCYEIQTGMGAAQ